MPTQSVDRDGLTINYSVEPEFEEIYRDVFIEAEYDVSLSTSAPRVLDCGAHIGISVLRTKQRYPGARVTAFEPNPATFDLLRANMTANQLTDVELVNSAVTAEPGEVSFHVSTDGWGMRDSVAPKRWHDGEKDRLITVPSVSLHPYLGEHVDLLKLDIEGSETSVLESVASELGKVDNIVMEYHDDIANPDNTLERILSVLDAAGFDEVSFVQGHEVSYEHLDRTPPRWVAIVRARRSSLRV